MWLPSCYITWLFDFYCPEWCTCVTVWHWMCWIGPHLNYKSQFNMTTSLEANRVPICNFMIWKLEASKQKDIYIFIHSVFFSTVGRNLIKLLCRKTIVYMNFYSKFWWRVMWPLRGLALMKEINEKKIHWALTQGQKGKHFSHNKLTEI